MTRRSYLGLTYALAAFMAGVGVTHFVDPGFFVAIVPPFLPRPELLVAVSGAAELGLGLALLVPRLRRLAAWGVIALLIAVYPANIYHAVSGGLEHPDLPAIMASPVVAWARLPFQLVFLGWAWLVARGAARA
jgi:uncharacterized membrane protein